MPVYFIKYNTATHKKIECLIKQHDKLMFKFIRRDDSALHFMFGSKTKQDNCQRSLDQVADKVYNLLVATGIVVYKSEQGSPIYFNTSLPGTISSTMVAIFMSYSQWKSFVCLSIEQTDLSPAPVLRVNNRAPAINNLAPISRHCPMALSASSNLEPQSIGKRQQGLLVSQLDNNQIITTDHCLEVVTFDTARAYQNSTVACQSGPQVEHSLTKICTTILDI